MTSTELPQQFGERLKIARQDAELSQEQMSVRMLIPKRTIQDWEGSRHIPPEYVQRFVLRELEGMRVQVADGCIRPGEQHIKNAYPIVLSPCEDGFVVFVPDFGIHTEGDNLVDAIEMARDAIGLIGIDMEDDGKTLPEPSALKDIPTDDGELLTLVDIDFTEYRRLNG